MFRRLTLLILLACATSACESTSNYEPPRPGALEESQWRERVNMGGTVNTIVAVDEVLESRQNGLLRVQLEMRNITATERSFRTLIEWFDVSGFKLDSPNDGWMSHIVQPNQSFSVNANAVDPAAVTWRVNIERWSR